MSKEITKAFGGGLPATFNPEALQTSLAKLPRTSEKPFLSFKDGEWMYGAEQAECGGEEELWAVNPASFMFGLIEWCDSEAGGEILVPMGTPYTLDQLDRQFDPDEDDVRVVPQVAADLACVIGDNERVEVTFKSSTRGGVSALNKLADAILRQYENDPENYVPVVQLLSDSYMHKKYKRKTYVPILEIQKWDNFELLNTLQDETESGEQEEEQEEETQTRKRGRRAAKANGKDTDDKPARRVRRRRTVD